MPVTEVGWADEWDYDLHGLHGMPRVFGTFAPTGATGTESRIRIM